MATTKGQMVKELKQAGVRKATKQGVGDVQLEHLKYADVCKLWTNFFTKGR